MRLNLIPALIVTSCLFASSLQADVILRMDYQHGPHPVDDVDQIDIRLLSEQSPVTVANFLNYVNATTVNGGKYENSFFSRVVDGFVIQTGAFSFDPAIGDGSFSYDSTNNLYNGGLQLVPKDDAILNEYDLPNIRGTLAMAKVEERLETVDGFSCPFQSTTCFLVPGTGVNSATSEWFINLADNSTILNTTNNGGFAVFGRVVNNTMSVVDSFAANPIVDKTDIHPFMGTLPLTDYVSGPVQQQNLIYQKSTSELLTLSADPDFDIVFNGTNNELTFTIENTGSSGGNLSIGAVADTDTLALPFSFISDTCDSAMIAFAASCEIKIDFSPTATGEYDDTFNIEFPALSLSLSIGVSGRSDDTIEPDIAPTLTQADFGEQPIYDPANGLPENITIFVHNEGNTDLVFTSVTLGGTDPTDFSFTNNCNGRTLEPAEFCVLPVNFIPATIGAKSATLTIITNDPDEGTFVIPLTGAASLDVDGVALAVEDAAPNNGDGNNDGILDSQQSYVASIPDVTGGYSTLAIKTSNQLRNLSVLDAGNYPPAPDGVDFDFGVYKFDIDTGIFTSALGDVGLILPSGTYIQQLYYYGTTVDDSNPAWRIFDSNGFTGSSILGESTLKAPDNSQIARSLVLMFALDGGRGDSDGVADGKISVMIAPVRGAPPADDGLATSPLILLLLLSVVYLARRSGNIRPH